MDRPTAREQLLQEIRRSQETAKAEDARLRRKRRMDVAETVVFSLIVVGVAILYFMLPDPMMP